LSLQNAYLMLGPWMTCSKNVPSQTPSVRCVQSDVHAPLKAQSVSSV